MDDVKNKAQEDRRHGAQQLKSDLARLAYARARVEAAKHELDLAQAALETCEDSRYPVATRGILNGAINLTVPALLNSVAGEHRHAIEQDKASGGTGDVYMVLCRREVVGNCAGWHAHHGQGYVCDIHGAALYTSSQAQNVEGTRSMQYGDPMDIAIPYDIALAHATTHVRQDSMWSNGVNPRRRQFELPMDRARREHSDGDRAVRSGDLFEDVETGRRAYVLRMHGSKPVLRWDRSGSTRVTSLERVRRMRLVEEGGQ